MPEVQFLGIDVAQNVRTLRLDEFLEVANGLGGFDGDGEGVQGCVIIEHYVDGHCEARHVDCYDFLGAVGGGDVKV